MYREEIVVVNRVSHCAIRSIRFMSCFDSWKDFRHCFAKVNPRDHIRTAFVHSVLKTIDLVVRLSYAVTRYFLSRLPFVGPLDRCELGRLGDFFVI